MPFSCLARNAVTYQNNTSSLEMGGFEVDDAIPWNRTTHCIGNTAEMLQCGWQWVPISQSPQQQMPMLLDSYLLKVASTSTAQTSQHK